jgi:RHS repeat-associated protein
MAMKKRFYSVNGQMMGYEEGGVKKDFLTDHLGSITAEIDQTQTRTYDTRYSAYGRNNWSTGTGCGFGWVGSYGYRETGLFHMSHYVRARHYSYVTGAWSTVDPLWPEESAYGYGRGRSTGEIDPSGKHPCSDRTKGYGDQARGSGGQNWGANCFEMVSGVMCLFIQLVSIGKQHIDLPHGGTLGIPRRCAEWADCINKGLYDCVARGVGCSPSSKACWDRTRESGGYGTPPHPCVELENLGCPPSRSADPIKRDCCNSSVFCEQEQYGFLNSPQGKCGKIDSGCSAMLEVWARRIGIKFPFGGSTSDRQAAASNLCCKEKVWDSGVGRWVRRQLDFLD